MLRLVAKGTVADAPAEGGLAGFAVIGEMDDGDMTGNLGRNKLLIPVWKTINPTTSTSPSPHVLYHGKLSDFVRPQTMQRIG